MVRILLIRAPMSARFGPALGFLRGVFACALAVGCSSSAAGEAKPEEPAPDPADVSVAIGTPGGPDGLDFVPLESGTELRLQTFGQGGTHLLLGVRCVNFGKRAFVGFTITNLNTGAQITAPPPARPQLLFCHEDDERVCDLVPTTVMMGGIADPDEERHGLGIELRVEASNTEGAHAESRAQALLSTADLE